VAYRSNIDELSEFGAGDRYFSAAKNLRSYLFPAELEFLIAGRNK